MGHLALFVFAVVVLCASPGPDMLLIVRTSLREGFKIGGASVLGVSVSSGAWGIWVAVGLGRLMKTSEYAFNALLCVGAAYLTYSGLQTLYAAFFKKNESAELLAREEAIPPETTVKGAFAKGFMTDFLNPLAGVFVLTFFPQYLPRDHTGQATEYFLLLAALYFLGVMTCYLPLAYVSAKGARILSHPRIIGLVDIASGIMFLSFSFRLITMAKFG